MLIKIDNRENKLIELITHILTNNSNEYTEITSSVEKLDLGDIILYDENTNKELIIIERKSINDLACSIKDGRYSEQSFRLMNSNIHNHNILYLIEGNIMTFKEARSNFKNPIHYNTLYSSIISLSFIKGFSTFRTNNIDETAHFILRLAYKLNKDKKPLFYENNKPYSPLTLPVENDNNINLSTEYCNVIKRTKKDNITNNNIGIIMLMQIPQVSLKSAKAIMDKYNNNFKLLLDDMNINKNCLDNITYICDTKLGSKEKKISKNVIVNIFSYLIPNNYIKI